MKTPSQPDPNQRRTFLKQVATGAAILGTGMLATPFQSSANAVNSVSGSDTDEWFKQVKGKHRIIFDVSAPNGSAPFAWPRVFLMTNAKTGTPENECGVVVVLRHSAIPYAMHHQLWEKYKFGELFKITDDLTKAPATKNPFWEPKPGTFKIPGLGGVQIGINELQASGVLFCVCDMALTVHSAVVAKSTNQDETAVKQEWLAGILPGVQVAPSGIWAVGRAQEHGCAYCFAG
ncbi:MAG TPA: twin-arginine translocation signal domain-containing protein [Mucilaginibacter sp.]|jgi:intracellular sulfur oxidation DsrE/DsrF family protein|nr:twin-arginine translocation signal domain-containing protein [Mucilaginibacter sp.]